MSVEVNYGKDVITYYLSRDSAHGKLDPVINMWWRRPIRTQKAGYVIWVASDGSEAGYFGEYTPEQVVKWFRVAPDTDRELVVAEQWIEKDEAPATSPVSTTSPRVRTKARG